ncbi:MAG: ATP-dependent zinc metalloprotease FtsH [Holosporaceae bacterium]|jgi:cell division protease FtsH|nr:ATP-dependent zinc metalloprotease FtsH [Holosporaceae bacterium]
MVKKRIKDSHKNIAFWVIVATFSYVLFHGFFGPKSEVLNISYSDFIADVENGKITNVTIKGQVIDGITKDGRMFSSYDPHDPNLVSRLLAKNVSLRAGPSESSAPLFHFLFSGLLPLLIILGFLFFFMRQMQSSGNKALGFGKSKAKLLNEKATKITFADVAGVDEAKAELEEIVDFLKDPYKFSRLGGKIPKGVLLVGSPGTGKTLLARAIAGEANVPFFSISGSEFVEMFVGVGASRVRDMFEQGKKSAPCILFIDEIDAVGRHRGFGLGGGNDEREQTLNQLLVEMDGFEENSGVIIISATNRPEVLDPALLRPGRFDRHIVVQAPDLNGREKVLRVHLKNVPLSSDVDPLVLARGTPGFSGADLANLVNEAALLAARRGKRTVGMDELEESKDKVMMGAERRSMAMMEDEKKLMAYHEAGHAIVAINLTESDPIHKATIIPRGSALGMVMRLPVADRLSVSRVKLEADMAVAAGGRIAEELTFGHEKITTGASSDIENVTRIARHMVVDWGMSDKLGFLSYADEGVHEVFLGHSSSANKNISEVTAQEIDAEIRAIVDRTYKKAEIILKNNLEALKLLADGLLEHETLSGEEIKKIVEGQKVEKKNKKEDHFHTSEKTKMPTVKIGEQDKTEKGKKTSKNFNLGKTGKTAHKQSE